MSDTTYKISRMVYQRFGSTKLKLPEYNPSATAKWIRYNSGLPWLPLDIQIPLLLIQQEIKNIEHLLVDHRSEYNEHSGWKSFCIHGKSYNATREDQFYNDDRPLVWTEQAYSLMPETVKYFKNYWPGLIFSRIRVMLLEPGGYINLHRDYDVSKLSSINIPIIHPTNCNMVMEQVGTVPFMEGIPMLLDVSNRHTIINESSMNRYHIIVHQDLNTEIFDSVLKKSYNQMYGF